MGAAQRVTQYLTRVGEYAPAEVDYLTRTSADTVERGDLVDMTIGKLPGWAQGNVGAFFAEAEIWERGGTQRAGRWATTWQIALPRELTTQEQWDMGTAFVSAYLADHAYLCVMHDPVKGGMHQPHLHVVFSERVDHGQVTEAATYFRRAEVGGCAKDRWFSQRGSVQALKDAWADWANYTLERAGHEARVHSRSLYDRDIARKPEPKVGYSADPVLHAARDAIRAQRNSVEEQARAAAGWDARKARLGIADVQQIAPADFLRDTYTRARQRGIGQWSPERAAQLTMRRLEAQARRQEQQAALRQSLHAHGAELRVLEAVSREEPAPRRGLQVQLYEPERGGYGR